MAESIAFSKGAQREQIYAELLPQIEALIADEPDLIANLANVAAVLKSIRFLLGRFLFNQGRAIGSRAISRTACVYAFRIRQWCMRTCLFDAGNGYRTQC